MGFFSTAVGAIAGAFGKVLSVASTLLTPIAPYVRVAYAAAKVFTAILKVAGTIKSMEDPEKIGEASLQAREDGLKPENYDSTKKWMEAIRKHGIDPERAEKRKISNPNAAITEGLFIGGAGCIEEYGQDLVKSIAGAIAGNPAYLKLPERVEALADMISTGEKSVGDVMCAAGYLSGKEKNDENLQRGFNTLRDVEKKIHPDMSDAEITKNIIQATA